MRDDVLENEKIAMGLFSRKGTAPPFLFVYGGRRPVEIDWEWKLEDEYIDLTKWQRTLHLTDPETHLRVSATCTIYTDTPGFEWTLGFMNMGPNDSLVLEDVQALNIEVAVGVPVVLHRLRGSKCEMDDWLPFETTLHRGMVVEFRPSGGRSSDGACPFYNVEFGPGGGVITAIGWSGQWGASVEYTDAGKLRLCAGMEHLRTILRSGEMISGPRVLQVWWEGDIEDSYNLFRRTMFAHVLPRIEGELIVPPIADLSSTCKYEHAMTEETELAQIKFIHDNDLGFEVYWIDAMYSKSGFPFGIGNYALPVESACDPERFPRGLSPIGEAVAEAGMEFMLWVEPERVSQETYLYEKHPEWVLTEADRSDPLARYIKGQNLFNLGISAARKYMTDYLIETVRKYKVGWLRFDFNISPLPFWDAIDAKNPNRVGMAEIRYIEGLYQMWDDIREACPGVKLDNCASGGRRIDLETVSRSHALWRTDFLGQLLVDFRSDRRGEFEYAAMLNHGMSAALNRYVPLTQVGQAGSTPYLIRSGFNGGLSFVEDSSADGYPVEELRRGLMEAKRLRPYLLGDFYVLSDVTVDPTKWLVMQWHRPEEDAGMVLAFRRHESPYETFVCKLRQLTARRYYVRRSVDGLVTEWRQLEPWELQNLVIPIEECPGSSLLEYRRSDVPAT